MLILLEVYEAFLIYMTLFVLMILNFALLVMASKVREDKPSESQRAHSGGYQPKKAGLPLQTPNPPPRRP